MLVLLEEDVLHLVRRVLSREGERHEGETLLVEAVEQHVRDTHGLPSAGNLGEEHVKAALDVGLHELPLCCVSEVPIGGMGMALGKNMD